MRLEANADRDETPGDDRHAPLPGSSPMRESGLDYVAWLRKQSRGDPPQEPEPKKPLNPAVDPPFFI